jgi:hypothetical protein
VAQYYHIAQLVTLVDGHQIPPLSILSFAGKDRGIQ